jgi:hypothetical protein
MKQALAAVIYASSRLWQCAALTAGDDGLQASGCAFDVCHLWLPSDCRRLSVTHGSTCKDAVFAVSPRKAGRGSNRGAGRAMLRSPPRGARVLSRMQTTNRLVAYVEIASDVGMGLARIAALDGFFPLMRC